jgi:hypothetical protein
MPSCQGSSEICWSMHTLSHQCRVGWCAHFVRDVCLSHFPGTGAKFSDTGTEECVARCASTVAPRERSKPSLCSFRHRETAMLPWCSMRGTQCTRETVLGPWTNLMNSEASLSILDTPRCGFAGRYAFTRSRSGKECPTALRQGTSFSTGRIVASRKRSAPVDSMRANSPTPPRGSSRGQRSG